VMSSSLNDIVRSLLSADLRGRSCARMADPTRGNWVSTPPI
jgi:hypothetical protein